MLWIILGLVVALVVAYIVASKFSEIAEMKGHNGSTYFWYTFWLGIYGILMVIALPNIKSAENKVVSNKSETPPLVRNETQVQPVALTQASNSKDVNKENPPVSAEISNGEKVCPKCGQSQRADRRVCWSCGQQFDN